MKAHKEEDQGPWPCHGKEGGTGEHPLYKRSEANMLKMTKINKTKGAWKQDMARIMTSPFSQQKKKTPT